MEQLAARALTPSQSSKPVLWRTKQVFPRPTDGRPPIPPRRDGRHVDPDPADGGVWGPSPRGLRPRPPGPAAAGRRVREKIHCSRLDRCAAPVDLAPAFTLDDPPSYRSPPTGQWPPAPVPRRRRPVGRLRRDPDPCPRPAVRPWCESVEACTLGPQ